jgi:hypothetical protein
MPKGTQNYKEVTFSRRGWSALSLNGHRSDGTKVKPLTKREKAKLNAETDASITADTKITILGHGERR